MHPVAQTMLILSLAVIASTLVLAALDLRHIRLALTNSATKPLQSSGGSASDQVPSNAGYAIYAFRQGRWVLEADFSKPGYEPAPVSMAGSYEGQVVKKESALRTRG
jgi:hypothetical protein